MLYWCSTTSTISNQGRVLSWKSCVQVTNVLLLHIVSRDSIVILCAVQHIIRECTQDDRHLNAHEMLIRNFFSNPYSSSYNILAYRDWTTVLVTLRFSCSSSVCCSRWETGAGATRWTKADHNRWRLWYPAGQTAAQGGCSGWTAGCHQWHTKIKNHGSSRRSSRLSLSPKTRHHHSQNNASLTLALISILKYLHHFAPQPNRA